MVQRLLLMSNATARALLKGSVALPPLAKIGSLVVGAEVALGELMLPMTLLQP
jgi:hypothetical protein